MIVIDTYVAVTLVVLAAVAALAAVVLMGTLLGRATVTHHRLRVARHESIPTYYRHLAVGH